MRVSVSAVTALFLELILLGGAPLLADKASVRTEATERFYRMELGGRPAGWLVERTLERDGVMVTESETRMELSRAGTATAVEMFSRFEESVDHRPLSGLIRQTLGSAPLETSFRFVDDEVLVAEPGGGTRRREMGPKTWMTPVEATEHIARQVQRAYAQARENETRTDAEGFAFEVRRLELLTGLEPITGRFVLQDADDPIEIDGETRPAGRWVMSESYAPLLTTRSWIDREGILLRTESDLMGTSMVMTLTARDPRVAAAKPPGHAEMPELPELLLQTFVRPDRPIESPRRVRQGVYRLRLETPGGTDLADVVPTLGVQTARTQRTASSDAGLVVTVDLTKSDEPETDEPDDVDLQPYLQASRYLDFESDEVQTLAGTWRQSWNRASTESPEPSGDAARAESLRRLVADHLGDKNLGTVLGSASEAAAGGAGDCTEHAVLLAALLRTQKIPSRIAVGLVYAESFAGERDLFAYHMWTQALLEEGDHRRWVDLDATLPQDTPFDATHILFATSPLAEEGVPLLGTGVEAIFGRLEIEVLETATPPNR